MIRVDGLHVGRSLRRVLHNQTYTVRFDSAFERVIRACQTTPRAGQDGTSITGDMERAYVRLHPWANPTRSRPGRATSSRGGCKGGRWVACSSASPCLLATHASKVALVAVAHRVRPWGFPLIDAQVPTPHTLAMGAEEWPRGRFLDALREALKYPTHKGNWASEPELERPVAPFA